MDEKADGKLSMAVREDIEFKLPAGWNLSASNGGLSLLPPPSAPQADIAIRVETLSVKAAKDIRLLEKVQVTVAGCYPAYTVSSLLERPLEKGTCVEAILKPRQGSLLHPAQIFAVLLSRHLVLIDFRRSDTASHLDPVVRRLSHGLSEHRVPVVAARQFAAARRGESRLVRRALGQWQVFLCHNSNDKQQVRELRDRLFDEGIVAWFDENEVNPGRRFVPKIEEGLAHVDAVIVARGSNGFGEWQQLEYGVALNEYVRRSRSGGRALKIIPVALPGAPPLKEWTGFLGTFNGVEFEKVLTAKGIRDLVRQILPG
jgi:hypothetical protein